MSLCRYLPVPSDRMAVMWTLLTVGDAVVLEYGGGGANAAPVMRAIADALCG